jgi:CDP-diacylglycerol--serine O-phosphatidyltransferase
MLTLCNFVCGFAAILFCMHTIRTYSQDPEQAQLMLTYACAAVFLAMIFDMLDGQVARMTGAESQFGAELDSLADDCTFGVAPAAIVSALWLQVQPESAQWYGQVMLCGVVYAACAILRLARYNVEVGTVDRNYFTGLPSPAAAGAVVSAVLFSMQGYFDRMWDWLAENVPHSHQVEAEQMEARVLGLYMLVMGVMMVSRLRFSHLAKQLLGGRKPFTYLVLAIFVLLLLFHKPAEVLFFLFNGYVLIGVLGNVRRRFFVRALPTEKQLGFDFETGENPDDEEE